jgi:hypothetical protein
MERESEKQIVYEVIEVKTENMDNIPMPKIVKREYEMYELKGVAYKTTDCRLKNN